MSNPRTIKSLAVDDTTLILRIKGSTRPIMARILDITRDAQGRPLYLCLDRLVHRANEQDTDMKVDIPESPLCRVSVQGCYATEMVLEYAPAHVA
ncbi:hypothetical protein VRRI112168_02730 [Vreelandella rituensis]|uniref:Uncharacterized protein n=1 Tax=Vreelandella rituensis TaxID=2282306 RepID=A0A368U8Y8_9GAMM|nr:hypothetical protein [Halomonas rituensis]RCV93659.1 hypothetical protein DU506_00450 [Halomonas rituensis]